jgi:hypothetical protein
MKMRTFTVPSWGYMFSTRVLLYRVGPAPRVSCRGWPPGGGSGPVLG